LLRRGAPTRLTSETVGSNNPDKIGIKKEKRKNFKELFINLNGRPGCTQKPFGICPRRPLKSPKVISEYNYNIQILGNKNNGKMTLSSLLKTCIIKIWITLFKNNLLSHQPPLSIKGPIYLLF